MIGYVSNVTGTAVGAGIPSQLIVGPTQAWLVVFAVLAVCCLLLWFLSKPTGRGRAGGMPANDRVSRRGRSTLAGRTPGRRRLPPLRLTHNAPPQPGRG